MYISSLTVKNFRSIDYVHLKFSRGKNVIVGKNNSGKSNIIKALNLIMGDKMPTYQEVSLNDFHCIGDSVANSFWISCSLKGNDIDQDTFMNCKGQWRGRLDSPPFTVSTLGQVEVDQAQALFNPDEYFGAIERKWNKTWIKEIAQKSQLMDELNSAIRVCALFFVSRDEDGEEEFTKEFRIFYQTVIDGPWYCLWNVSNKIRESILTSAILPAFREPGSQLRINNYSWYGKLLKRAWEAKRNEPFNAELEPLISLQDKLDEAYQQVNGVGAKVFGGLSEDIKNRINVAFRDIELAFNFFVSRGEVYKQTQIYVNDGFDSLLQEKGSGIQSAILIGLFSYYCSLFHQNTTLLAIEEPELFLHPQARRVISHRLNDFVDLHKSFDEDAKENQVLITTHSSEFIRAGEINSICVIRKTDGKTQAASYSINASDKKVIQALLRSENSEMFFADKVIICEGGEKYILPYLADFLISGVNVLDEVNISIVRANGKGDISKYVEILKACNIPYYVLADLDYFFEGLNQELDDDIASLRALGKQILEREGDLKSNKEIKKHLNSSNSLDAKAFCAKMEELKNGNTTTEEVLSVWEAIAPKVSKKITKEHLFATSNLEFKKLLNVCLDRIWDLYDIYILREGELEDYLLPSTLQIQGSKETKLLNIIDSITQEKPISDFINVPEFVIFLGKVLGLSTAQGIEEVFQATSNSTVEE